MAKTLTSYYCSRTCTDKAYKMRKKLKQQEEQLQKVADGVDISKDYLTVKEAAAIYKVSEASLYKMIETHKINSVLIGEKKSIRLSRSELEAKYPKRKNPVVDEDAPQLYDMNPKHCYSIGDICKKFDIDDSSVWAHIRKYSIPTRQVGNYVYAPKSEIDKLYQSL